jgi:hypothetical protein
MIGIRKLGIAISAAVIGGAGLTGVLWSGTAHAQSADSISVTSVVLGTSINQLGSPEAVVTFSVTCPANDGGVIDLTTSQGGTGSGDTSVFACTGSAQSVSVTANYDSTEYGVGQVFVGAALDVVHASSSSTGPYGIGAGTASIVPIS